MAEDKPSEKGVGSLIKIVGGGLAIGTAILVGNIGGDYFSGPNILQSKIFQREEGRPSVMRLYREGQDGIMVESLGLYIPLDQYLETIEDVADRNIEEASIEKIVKWHEE